MTGEVLFGGSRAASRAGRRGRRRRIDLVAVAVPAGYLLMSVYLYSRLWSAPARRYLVDSGQDQQQWQWFFAVVADNLRELRNPLFTHLQNAPQGVNLMANTTMPGLSIPLAPITWLFGSAITWILVLTLGMAGSAWAWYHLMRRHVRLGRLPAAVAGWLCGFSPPIISHGNAHPNLVVLFVVPFLIGRFLMLVRGEGGIVRNGVLLGLLTWYQVLLGEEALLIAVVGMGMVSIGYWRARPAEVRACARRVVRGLGVALAVLLPLSAYLLYWQLAGPQSYRVLPHDPSSNDVEALISYSRRSLAGSAGRAAKLAFGNPTEENSFFGPSLILLAAGCAWWLRRRAIARVLMWTAVVAAVLSLGAVLTVGGHDIPILGPWLLVGVFPPFDSMMEGRLTMICFPAIAVLLGLAMQRALALAVDGPGGWQRRRWIVRGAVAAALLAALAPIFPTPYPVVDRAPTPRFFTSGAWRDHVRPGRTLVPVPLPSPTDATALHWQVESGLGFNLPAGYFVGPRGPRRIGHYGAAPRPTSRLLDRVRRSGEPPVVTPRLRRQMRADLAYWKADAVLLDPRVPQAPLRTTLDRLLGAGRKVGGVWVWDVH